MELMIFFINSICFKTAWILFRVQKRSLSYTSTTFTPNIKFMLNKHFLEIKEVVFITLAVKLNCIFVKLAV